MGRPPVKPPASLDRGLLPSLLGYVLRRAQSAVFDDFANTFAKAGEALTPGEFGLLVRGLLMRHRSPTDGRTHALALTPAGEKALARFARLVRAHEKRIASQLSAAEIRVLIDLLEKVHTGARSL